MQAEDPLDLAHPRVARRSAREESHPDPILVHDFVRVDVPLGHAPAELLRQPEGHTARIARENRAVERRRHEFALPRDDEPCIG